MRLRTFLTALLALGLLSACGDDGEVSSTPTTANAFVAGYYQTAANDYRVPLKIPSAVIGVVCD